jgi:hypothetical protein
MGLYIFLEDRKSLKNLTWSSGSGVPLTWVSDVDDCEVDDSGSRMLQADKALFDCKYQLDCCQIVPPKLF